MTSMSFGTAILYYLVRMIMFGAVAALGIALGIRFRKKKNEK